MTPNRGPQGDQETAGATAQLDVMLTFFGIILVFLSLLTFAVTNQQEEPRPTDYRAIEPPIRAVHTPALAYAVPFYDFLLLDERGLFELDLGPVAAQLLDSSLRPTSFGKSLRTASGLVYGTLALEPLDLSGFWMQLDAEALHHTELLRPLIPIQGPVTGDADPGRALLSAARQLAGRDTPGYAMLHYADGQEPLADSLVSLLVGYGWRLRAQPLRDGKIILRRHPDYFVLTDYFR